MHCGDDPFAKAVFRDHGPIFTTSKSQYALTNLSGLMRPRFFTIRAKNITKFRPGMSKFV